jgi:hypothetical protein
MMAVMLLGMPPLHSCLTNTGSEASRGGNRLEPRTYPPILTGESRGIPATGEQNKPEALHETSPAEQGESATSWVLQQIQLDTEKVREVKEEMQEKRLEMQRAHQLEMEKMLRAHQLGMEEMRRTFWLEMEEMKRTSQLREEGTQDTHQLQAKNQRHLGEVWKPGDDGPILARVGGANLPADGGGTASNN